MTNIAVLGFILNVFCLIKVLFLVRYYSIWRDWSSSLL